MYWPKVLVALQLFLVNCLIESASDQNLQRYLPLSEDEAVSTNQRFQQIMQSGNPSDIAWKQPKLKVEKVDVKAEIAKLNSTYVYQSEWPDPEIKLGAVTAVAFDKAGNVVIFHRVNRIWSQTTFDQKNVYTERYRGPIDESTVVAFDRKTGKVVYDWGKNIFYMPHGLTIDKDDNVWVTDVGLHQVMKFGPRGASADKPLLKLGTAFSPGNSDTKFCKPTSVAVLSNGDFFVADGYCNGRIVKYSASGEKILQWGHNSFSGEVYEYAPKNFFAIPHALTLVPEQGLVCTADRENGRVQCFYSNNGTFHSQYHSQIIGDRLFSMDYTPSEGGQLVVVNGPTGGFGHPDHYNEVRGYVLNMKSKQVISKFGPNDLPFSNPHDVAITEDGNEIYVAELDPTKVHKFLHKKVARSLPMSAAKPTATSVEPSADEQQQSQATTKAQPGSTALLVAALMIIFALLTFGMALLISRRRKRGCFPFGVKNRRHAWDFPSKPEGFKLTGLLDHRKRGFEKLDQNASDEEPDVTTNMLASAQFA